MVKFPQTVPVIKWENCSKSEGELQWNLTENSSGFLHSVWKKQVSSQKCTSSLEFHMKTTSKKKTSLFLLFLSSWGTCHSLYFMWWIWCISHWTERNRGIELVLHLSFFLFAVSLPFKPGLISSALVKALLYFPSSSRQPLGAVHILETSSLQLPQPARWVPWMYSPSPANSGWSLVPLLSA